MHIEAVWDEEFGDMRQELVLIGVDLPHEELETALQGALLTQDEFNAGEELWLTFDDPLPRWQLAPAGEPDAHEGHAQETADAVH